MDEPQWSGIEMKVAPSHGLGQAQTVRTILREDLGTSGVPIKILVNGNGHAIALARKSGANEDRPSPKS